MKIFTIVVATLISINFFSCEKPRPQMNSNGAYIMPYNPDGPEVSPGDIDPKWENKNF